MKEPKYKIGQKVWGIEKSQAVEVTITAICDGKLFKKSGWVYFFRDDFLVDVGWYWVEENLVFADKQSLIGSL